MLCVMPVLSAAVSLHQVSLVDLLYTVHAVDSYRGYKMLDLNREDEMLAPSSSHKTSYMLNN